MGHKFQFFRAGGFDQVRIATGEDVRHLRELDPKLWVAIACPSKNLDLDEHTLMLLDGDGDGRIRVPDVIAAAEWACSLLVDPEELFEGREALPFKSIDREHAEGKHVRASAKTILKNLGKADAKEISPADTRDTSAILAKTLFNGDGVVPPESAETDEATAGAIRDIMTVLGSDKDASGLDGVSRAKVEKFYSEVSAHLAWWRSAEGDAAVLPLGDDTPLAYEAYEAVRAKIDDFFARCGLAAMDARAGEALNPREADLALLSQAALSSASPTLLAFPIARIEAGRALPLEGSVNPAYSGAISRFRAECVAKLLGDRTSIDEAGVREIDAKLAGHRTWLATKPKDAVGALGIVRLRELVETGAQDAILALVAKDEALADEAKAIAAVDKLVHYYRDLVVFLRNFVSFEDFYGRRGKATFQSGTLYLDGRSFDLCMRVEDTAKHSSLAMLSQACLVYCDCTRDGGKEKRTIVAAVTDGDSDFLLVGRNGVFYDRKGRDWDATITKIVDEPISVRQAFWAPYQRLSRFVSGQIERFAGEKSQQSTAVLEQHAAIAPSAPVIAGAPAPAPAAPQPAAFDVARFAGVFAAIGLALGAIGTAAAAIITGFLELHWWQMPLAIAGIVLCISGPSMLLATLKLRQRNLGPLLDASGWAINTRARINIPFGATLTSMAELPEGSSRSLRDPYAEKKTPWKLYLALLAIIGSSIWILEGEARDLLRPYLRDVPVLRQLVREDAPPPAEP